MPSFILSGAPVASPGSWRGSGISPRHTERLIADAVAQLSADDAANPSHVYARILREAIKRHCVLDHLHPGDVLVALRSAGYVVDVKTGRLSGGTEFAKTTAPQGKRVAGGRR